MSPRNGRPERRQARGDSDSSSLALGQPGSKLPRALGLRGYQIAIAEAGTALGGRVTGESLADFPGHWWQTEPMLNPVFSHRRSRQEYLSGV